MIIWFVQQVMEELGNLLINDRTKSLLYVVLVEELMEGTSVIPPLGCIIGNDKVPGMSGPVALKIGR